MAYTKIPGLWIQPVPFLTQPPNLTVTAMGASTSNKLAYVGRMWNKDQASKNITKVGYRLGTTLVSAGASDLTVSIQTVSTVAGPPYQPTGTLLGATNNATTTEELSAHTASTWHQTTAFAEVAAVTFGQHIAVVFGYANYAGADNFSLANLGSISGGPFFETGFVTNTGSWAVTSAVPNIILEFDDGTFGTLEGAFPFSATSTLAHNVDSATTDEYALGFQVPVACKSDGAWMLLNFAASAEAEINLNDASGVLTGGTITVGPQEIVGAASTRAAYVTWTDEVTLAANTQYYLSARPTTTNNITVYYWDVSAANHFQAFPGGTTWNHSKRIGQGAWDALTTTRRLFGGIRISSIETTASGGASGVIGG